MTQLNRMNELILVCEMEAYIDSCIQDVHLTKTAKTVQSCEIGILASVACSEAVVNLNVFHSRTLALFISLDLAVIIRHYSASLSWSELPSWGGASSVAGAVS